MHIPFHVLGGSASFVILRPKTTLGLKRPGWMMKRWCTLMALMDPNGSVAMAARSAINCPMSSDTEQHVEERRWPFLFTFNQCSKQ